jgi:hypothetical protein
MKKTVPHVAASPYVFDYADDLVQPCWKSSLTQYWMNDYGNARRRGL